MVEAFTTRLGRVSRSADVPRAQQPIDRYDISWSPSTGLQCGSKFQNINLDKKSATVKYGRYIDDGSRVLDASLTHLEPLEQKNPNAGQ